MRLWIRGTWEFGPWTHSCQGLVGSIVLAGNLPSGTSFWHHSFPAQPGAGLLLGSHYRPRLCQEPGFPGTHLRPQPVPGELMWGQAGTPGWV